MPDTVYGKPAPNGDERIVYKQYIGVLVPLRNGKPGRLGKYDIRRLRGREQSNRGRVRSMGPAAIVEPVDFIGRCIEQEWLCWICKEPMDVGLHGTEPNAISVEHDPAVSVAKEHSPKTVYGAHQRCNHAKACVSDIPRAAKIKRVQKAEDRHATLMRCKANMARAIYRQKRKEAVKGKRPLKSSGRKMQSRPFDRTKTRGFDGRVRERT